MLGFGRLKLRINRAITNNYRRLKHTQKFDFLSSSIQPITIPDLTTTEFIFQSFDRFPNKIAVECEFTGKRYTYDDIRLKSHIFNTNLRKKFNLKRGDVIGILLPNVADFPVCTFGALQAGLVVTAINPFYTSGEISRQLSDSEAKAIVTLGSLYNTAKDATKIAKSPIPIFTIKTKSQSSIPEGAVDLNEFLQAKSDVIDIDVSPNDLAFLVYTSGTTGSAKGVQHTHRGIVANLSQLNSEEMQFFPHRSETWETRHLAILPWFHVYGLVVVLLNQLYLLAKLICVPKFSPEIFTNMLVNYKPTGLHLVPSLIMYLANNPSIKPELLESIKTIVYASAPLSKIDIHRFLNKVNNTVNLIQGYGLTETHGVFYTLLKTKTSENVCAMEPIPNTSVKITAPNNNTYGLGPNQLGEILVKGPQIMKAYHNRPNETDNAFADGWFKTEDLGYYDQNGLIYIVDRLKDIIKVNSFQVAPTELEDLIREFPGVQEVSVVGVPDKRCGEVPLAFVVPTSEANLNVDDLQGYVSKRVVKYKQIKNVIVLDSLPKNSTGKVLRKDLLETYKNKSGNL
ncbi:hypothetical protein FQR65_LT08775 [Abscondita terminalis]|nr:hypothetical protein FQR65_LT08775 [Abscondita terminalis]